MDEQSKIDNSITIYLRQYFDDNLGPQFCTIDKYANVMGINQKKLQRLLNQEGTSFSKSLNDYRAKQTLILLSQKHLRLSTIALKLGYSSGEAFNTACKRWYKQSPRKLRYEIMNSL